MELMPDRKGAFYDGERPTQHEVELIKLRDNRTPLVFKLMSGEVVEGAIRWFDNRALRVILADRAEMTLMLQAIAYYNTRV